MISKLQIIEAQEMHEVLQRFVTKVGSQRDAASRLMVSPQHLNDLIRRRREISSRVSAQLGYSRRVVFQKASKR